MNIYVIIIIYITILNVDNQFKNITRYASARNNRTLGLGI